LKVEGLQDAGQLKVFIKVTSPVNYQSFTLTGPNRLVINLTPCLKGSGPIPDLNRGPVQRLRSSQFNEDTVRIVLDLRHPVSYTLSPQVEDPSMLLVAFTGEGEGRPRGAKSSPETAKAISIVNNKENGPSKPKKVLEGVKRNIDIAVPTGHPAGLREGNEGIVLAEQAVKIRDFSKAIGILKRIEAETPDKNIWKSTGQPLLRQALTGQIKSLFEKGDHREVLRLYGLHRGTLQEGVDPGLLQQIGNSYKGLGFYDPAVRFYQAAWQGGGQGSPGLVLDWAEALAGQGQSAEAAASIQNVLDRPVAAGDQPQRAFRLLARCQYQQRLYHEALKTLEMAGRRFPKWDQDPENLYLQGLVCFEIPGSGPKALQAFRQFVALGQDPVRLAVAYEKIGDLCFGDNKYEAAWRAYYQAGRLQPETQGTFLAKKIAQCRLLVEERPGRPAPENGTAESDPFWKKILEYRSAQQKLDKKIGELRLN
jgi:tetratricopeptide (TPR) repeat protein